MFINLNSSTRFISFQFMLSEKFVKANPGFLDGFRAKPVEVPQEHDERKTRMTGTLMVPPTPKTSLAFFLGDLKNAGYILVAGTTQFRQADGGKWRHVARFTFLHPEFAKPASPEFERVRADLEAKFTTLCFGSMWRAQVWTNPVYLDGKIVEGQRSIDIDLKERLEICKPDGSPVLVWQKDAQGNRVGETKVPLKPAEYLRSYESLPPTLREDADRDFNECLDEDPNRDDLDCECDPGCPCRLF